jgi:hypothetical protein
MAPPEDRSVYRGTARVVAALVLLPLSALLSCVVAAAVVAGSGWTYVAPIIWVPLAVAVALTMIRPCVVFEPTILVIQNPMRSHHLTYEEIREITRPAPVGISNTSMTFRLRDGTRVRAGAVGTTLFNRTLHLPGLDDQVLRRLRAVRPDL